MKTVDIAGVGLVDFPDEMSDKQIELAIRQRILPSMGIQQEDRQGLIPAFKSGLHGLGSQMANLGAGAAGMVGADSIRDSLIGVAKDQRLEAELDLPVPKTFESVGQTYKDKGIFAAAPEFIRMAGETVASGLPQMAPMLIPGTGWGAAALRGAGLFLPQIGANIGHQLDEGAKPENISMTKAALTAIPQTALFALSEGMIAKPLNDAMSSVGLKAAMSALGQGAQQTAKEAASRKLTQIASDTLRHSLKGAAAQSAAMGGVSALEHLQALQPGQEFGTTGWDEMKSGAAHGALFGGAMGAAMGPLHGMGEAKQLAVKEAVESRVKKAREEVREAPAAEGTGPAIVMSGGKATKMTLPAQELASIIPVEMMGESKIPKDSKPVYEDPAPYKEYAATKATPGHQAPGAPLPKLLDFMSIQMFGDDFKALSGEDQAKVSTAYLDKETRKTFTGDLQKLTEASIKAKEAAPAEEVAPPVNETPEAMAARLRAENASLKKSQRLSIADDIRKAGDAEEVTFDLTDAETKKRIDETPALKAQYDALHESAKPLFDNISQIFAGATLRYRTKGENAGMADPAKGHAEVRADADKLIEKRIANHEGSHLVRPLMDRQEKGLLEAAAKRTGVFDAKREVLYREKFAGLTPVEMKEMLGDEAAAHLIGAVSAGEVNIAGKPKNIIDRVKREAGKVANLMDGLGYQDAADVYRRVQAGEIGNRRFFTPESNTLIAPVRTEEERRNFKKIGDSPIVEGEPDAGPGERLSLDRPTIEDVNSNINARNRMFHATSPELALKIMKSGEIRDVANQKSEEPGVSFSRVPRINQKTEPIVFSVDQSEVSSRPLAHKNFPKVKYDDWAKESYPNENFEYENRTKSGAVPMSSVKGIAIDEGAVSPRDKFRVNNLERQAKQMGIPVHRFANSEELQSYRAGFQRDGVRLAIPDKIVADKETLDFAKTVQHQAEPVGLAETFKNVKEQAKVLKENKTPDGGLFSPVEDFIDRFRTNHLDRWQRGVRQEQKLGEAGYADALKPENSAMVSVRQAEKRVAVADAGMTEGPIMFDKDGGFATVRRDKDGNPVYADGSPAQGLLKSMKPLLEMSPNDQLLAGFVAQARRLKTEPKEKWGAFDDAAMAKADKLRKDNPHIDAALDGIKGNNESLVQFLVDTGAITEKVAAKWAEKDYTPMYRYVEENLDVLAPHESNSYKNLKISEKFKGSDYQVNDLLENVVRNHYAAVSLGLRNVANNRLVRNAQLLGQAREVKGQTGPDIVSFRVDGQHRSFKLDDPMMAKMMVGLEELSPTITKILAPASNWLRQGVTMSPTFWVSNITRDVFQNEFTSGRHIGNLATIIKGAGESIKAGGAVLQGKEQDHSPAYTALKDAGVLGGINIIGADGETKSNLMREYSRLYEDLPPVTDAAFLPKLIGRAIEAAHAASERSDAVTREKVYTDALERTGSKAQALIESMETLNFSRHGIHPFTRYLTMAVPFLNARAQGLDVLYRAAAGKSAHANPKQVQATLLKRGLAMAGIVGAYSMLMPHYDAYNNANQEERDNYFFIPLYGDDKASPMLRIPIPFEVGTIFKTVPERLWQYATGHDSGEDLRKSMASNLMGTLAFNPIPQVVKPILEAQPFDEAAPGWDSFRRRPVVERSTASLKPEFQFGDTTSEASKALGKAIGMAPDKIDHMIQGYTGSMGAYMLELSSAIVNQFGDKVQPAKERYQSPALMGLGKRFIQKPDSGGKLNKFYDLADEVGKLVQTVSVLQKQGRFDEMKALIEDPDNRKLMGVSDAVSSLKTQLGELRGQRRLIMNDKTMSPEKKKEILDSFRGYEIKLASQEAAIRKVLK